MHDQQEQSYRQEPQAAPSAADIRSRQLRDQLAEEHRKRAAAEAETARLDIIAKTFPR